LICRIPSSTVLPVLPGFSFTVGVGVTAGTR
jgi:hypothetical protein